MIVKYYKEATALAGVFSFNTNDLRGICHRVFIKPATASTTSDISFTDDNGLVIYEQKGLKGTLNDLTSQTLKGVYTVAGSNISADELFKIQIEYEEIAYS